MKHDVNDEVPNGTPKFLFFFRWAVKLGWGVKVRL
jgi:hypothetical protein